MKKSRKKRLFLGMMGLPFRDETVTTLFRLADAALAAGHEVNVWCCGGATHLSNRALGDVKPQDMASIGTCREERQHPTTAALVGALGRTYSRTFTWCVCRHCAEEHGAGNPTPPARIKPPLQFARLLDQADVAIVMGTK
jgi:hypothetical protein